MPRLPLVSAFVVLSACTAPPPSGNAPVSGMLMGPPLGWTTSSPQQSGIQVKGPGFTPGPVTPPPTGVPQVAFDTFVSGLVQGLNTAEPPLLAMSLGIDIIATTDVTVDASNVDPPDSTWPAGNYPVLLVGNHGWYAVVFTVDSDQVDEANDDLADDIKPPLDRDSSVFCYVLPASSSDQGGQYLLPNELESTRVLMPDHLGITGGAEIHAINMHIGLYQTDIATAVNYSQRDLPPTPALFFTLRPEFIASVDLQDLATRLNTTPDEVTPSTIFISKWKGGQWTGPDKWKTAAELEIEDPGTAVIDGLAIDTMNTAGDQILFSLRHSDERHVDPDDQMMHTQVATAGQKQPEPRRVVVFTGGGYGSLGRRMRAGRAIGDFCTADPWLPDPDYKYYTASGPKIPEDFEFARRKPNPRVGPQWVVLPISAMRAWSGREAVVRVCMATPRWLLRDQGKTAVPHEQPKTGGTVKLYWGHTDDVTQGHVKNGWRLAVEFALPPAPFHHDLPLVPDIGPVSVTSAAGTPADTVRGFVVRWELHLDGKVWHSPVSALRY